MVLDILAKNAELQACSRSELLKRWQEWFGKAAPRYISLQLLIRGITYKIQEKAYGGLAADVKRALDFSAKENRRKKKSLNTNTKILVDTVANLKNISNNVRHIGKTNCTQRSITNLNHTKSGTRFIREWKGELYEVTASRDSFIYQGKNYKSLSEIARLITGTRWNGPAFFGLRKTQKTTSPINEGAAA